VHELFLRLYARAAAKYGWVTLTWALVWNHHHFLIRLTDGGLSEGMRELHTSFARRIHLIYGLTGTGHLFRHGFFARQVLDDTDLWEQCRYIDLNAATAKARGRPDAEPWSGVHANLGLEHPRPFHASSELLQLFGSTPEAARSNYRQFLEDGLVLRGLGPSPNNGH
jgi:putative transposase